MEFTSCQVNSFEESPEVEGEGKDKFKDFEFGDD